MKKNFNKIFHFSIFHLIVKNIFRENYSKLKNY